MSELRREWVRSSLKGTFFRQPGNQPLSHQPLLITNTALSAALGAIVFCQSTSFAAEALQNFVT